MINYTDSSLNIYGMLVFGKIKGTTSKGYPV